MLKITKLKNGIKISNGIKLVIITKNDRWMTVKPHEDEGKGRHLLLEGNETPKEAMKRQWGVDLDKKKETNKEAFEKIEKKDLELRKEKLKKEKERIDKRIEQINDRLDSINKESDEKKKKILKDEFGEITFENQKEYYLRMAELTREFAADKERQQLLEDKKKFNNESWNIRLEINKNIAKETYHPNEISGVRKSMDMTFDDADGGRVNPNYKNGGKSNYEENCQSCVVAFEARLRGYNVEASKTTKLTNSLSWDAKKAWINPETGGVPNDIVPQDFDRIKGKPYNSEKYIDFLNTQIKEGNRYNMSFLWKSKRGRVGHVITMYKDKEGIKIYDPQSGKIEKDLKTFFKEVKFVSNSIGIKSNEIPQLYRVDNMSFNPEYFGVMVEANNDK